MVGKFAWGVQAKYYWALSTNVLYSIFCWQHPAMFCLYTFPAHNLVMGSNPGYLLKSFFTLYLPLCIVRGLWAHFRILPQCYWLLPWTNLAPSIGFPLCQFCQWTFYVSGKKRRVEKATFHEIRKRFFFAYFADQIEYLRIWNLLTGFRFWFREMS